MDLTRGQRRSAIPALGTAPVGAEDRDQGLQLEKRYSSWEGNGKAGLSTSDIIIEMVKNDQKYLTN